jgi:hypothetical protein
VGGIFDLLHTLPRSFAHPADVVDLLLARGICDSIAQWLTSECRPSSTAVGEYVRVGRPAQLQFPWLRSSSSWPC